MTELVKEPAPPSLPTAPSGVGGGVRGGVAASGRQEDLNAVVFGAVPRSEVGHNRLRAAVADCLGPGAQRAVSPEPE